MLKREIRIFSWRPLIGRYVVFAHSAGARADIGKNKTSLLSNLPTPILLIQLRWGKVRNLGIATEWVLEAFSSLSACGILERRDKISKMERLRDRTPLDSAIAHNDQNTHRQRTKQIDLEIISLVNFPLYNPTYPYERVLSNEIQCSKTATARTCVRRSDLRPSMMYDVSQLRIHNDRTILFLK